jgi:hypothetical protein
VERSDTHHLSMRAVQDDGFRKGSTHPTGCTLRLYFSRSHTILRKSVLPG